MNLQRPNANEATRTTNRSKSVVPMSEICTRCTGMRELMSLTEECARVTGIPYLMDAFREETMQILGG